jgi:hypothetical protein
MSSRSTVVIMMAVLLALLTVPSLACADDSGCPNGLSPGFRTYLPDCRAYELVTPPYKQSFPVVPVAISGDGLKLGVESFGSFSDPVGIGFLGQDYQLSRTGTGWETSVLGAPFSEFPNYHVETMSPDFQSSLWLASTPGQPWEDVYLDPSGGPLTLVGPGTPPGSAQTVLNFVGASDDLRHALFIDASQAAGEEARLWPGDMTIAGRVPSLYEYFGTGNAEPRLVGVSNVGIPASVAAGKLISVCGTLLGSSPEGEAYNAVSSNGAVVFFTAEECNGSPAVNELYARVDREKTVAISEPSHPLAQGSGSGPDECDVTCETAVHAAGVFEGASRDGSKVFFLTAQPLLNGDEDAEPDLYEAEIEGGGAQAKLGRLIQVSRDPNVGQAAEVQGVARVSEDGSHVYFVAKGVLTTEPDLSLPQHHQVAVAHEDNLYVYERDARYPDGHTSFIATLSARDLGDWSSQDARPVQATPEGRFLVFQSSADLTPDQEGGAEAGQVFEYDAQEETLIRVSRGQNGYNEDGNSSVYGATIPVQVYERDLPTQRSIHLAVSEDGSRVFFSSADALTPRALNGVVIGEEEGEGPIYASNVYEYHDGQVALISDGHDVTRVEGHPATELIGTDETGGDVFFTTADSLVPEDTDTQVDIYDARSEGGFVPAVEPAPCSADSCQGAVSAAPSLLTPTTSSVAGEANAVTSAAAPTEPKPKAKAKPKIKKGKEHKSKGEKRRSPKRKKKTEKRK